MNNEIQYILGINIDITENKKAEENLKESESKYHDLFETSPDGVILTNLQGTIIECNSAIELITGYSSGHFIGKNFMDLELYVDDALELLEKGYNDLFKDNKFQEKPEKISADVWLKNQDLKDDFFIFEHSYKLNDFNTVLSLIWVD